jgi:hypothetical protein
MPHAFSGPFRGHFVAEAIARTLENMIARILEVMAGLHQAQSENMCVFNYRAADE